MNLKEIADNIRTEGKKLQKGSKPEKRFAEQLAVIAKEIDEYRKANEKPLKPGEIATSRQSNRDFVRFERLKSGDCP